MWNSGARSEPKVSLQALPGFGVCVGPETGDRPQRVSTEMKGRLRMKVLGMVPGLKVRRAVARSPGGKPRESGVLEDK